MSSDQVPPSGGYSNVEHQMELINESPAQKSLRYKILSPGPYVSYMQTHDNTREFPQFPKLPMELRLTIWKSAVVPRMIFLNGKKGSMESQLRLWAYLVKESEFSELLRPGENAQSPVLLEACQESRREIGKLYRHRFCWFHDCRDYSTIQRDGFLLDFKVTSVSDVKANLKKIDDAGSIFNPHVDILVLRMRLDR